MTRKAYSPYIERLAMVALIAALIVVLLMLSHTSS
jgi:hypothetical protein